MVIITKHVFKDKVISDYFYYIFLEFPALAFNNNNRGRREKAIID